MLGTGTACSQHKTQILTTFFEPNKSVRAGWMHLIEKDLGYDPRLPRNSVSVSSLRGGVYADIQNALHKVRYSQGEE